MCLALSARRILSLEHLASERSRVWDQSVNSHVGGALQHLWSLGCSHASSKNLLRMNTQALSDKVRWLQEHSQEELLEEGVLEPQPRLPLNQQEASARLRPSRALAPAWASTLGPLLWQLLPRLLLLQVML